MGKVSKIRIMPALLLSWLLCACDPPWQLLDQAGKGDRMASLSDFVVFPDTKISYRESYSPAIVKLSHPQYLKAIGVRSAEGYSLVRSHSHVGWFQEKGNYLGTPEGVRFVSTPVADKSHNIIITVNYRLEGAALNYRGIVTIRQGRAFYTKQFKYDERKLCNTIPFRDITQRSRDSISCQSNRLVLNFLKKAFGNYNLKKIS